MEPLKLIRKIVVTGMCRGMTAAGTFAINLQLAWQLPSMEEYGQFAVCLTALIALQIFSRFGIDVAILRYAGAAWHIGDSVAYRRIIVRALALVASFSLLLSGLTAVVLWGWGDLWLSADVMAALLPALPFLAVSFIVGSAFKAAQRPETGALFEVGGTSLLACVIYAGWAWMGHPLTLYPAAKIFTVASTIYCVAGLTALYWTMRGAKQDVRAEHPIVTLTSFVGSAADFAVVAGAHVLGNWCGLFFVEWWHGSAAAGAFSAAMRIAMLPLLLQSILVTITSPRLAGLHAQQEQKKIRQLVQGAATMLFAATFPLLLLLALFSPLAISLFGGEYRDSWPVLSILAVGQFMGAVSGISTSALGMIGEQRLLRKIGVFWALLSIPTSAVLIVQYGVMGAAISTALYATFQAGTVALAAWRKLGFPAVPGLPSYIISHTSSESDFSGNRAK